MIIQEVIDRICKWHEPFTDHEGGRDKVLCGNPEQECTGIVVTVCATYEVVKQAAALGANLIISHESIFFGGRIGQDGLEDNEVYERKHGMIEDSCIVVWRDHDRMHGNGKPFFPERQRNDYIFYGICKELGWEDYVADDPMKPLLYHIPETTAGELSALLMDKFGLNGLRIVGNRSAKIKTVWFSEHVQGGKEDGAKIHKGLQADAIIPLEICDFTLTQFVRDAAAMGQDKVMLEMGHFNCEELGMKYCLKWLPEAIGESVPITFIPAGDTFEYITK